MGSYIKEMGVRDILDSTFALLKERFWTFQGVIFWSFLPALIILMMITGLICVLAIKISSEPFGPLFTDSRFGEELFSKLGILGIIVLIGLVILLIVSFLVGSLFFIHGTINIFKHGFHGKKCTLKEAFKGMKQKWLWYLLYFILLQIAMMIVSVPISIITAFTGTFIPYQVIIALQILSMIIQISISFFSCLTPIIIAVEETDAIKAFIRSFTLPAKHRWRILGTLLAVYFIIYALYAVFMGFMAIPVMLAITIRHIYIYILAGIFVIIGLLFLCAMMPFFFGPLTAIYYDLVVRKEGYDLQLQLEQQKELISINP